MAVGTDGIQTDHDVDERAVGLVSEVGRPSESLDLPVTDSLDRLLPAVLSGKEKIR